MLRHLRMPALLLAAATLAATLTATPAVSQPASPQAPAADKTARFVRIELPGSKRILTLAEVQIFSGDKNVAGTGKATQSSTHADASAARAIDGNHNPDWNAQGQTHTNNDGEDNPWWEVDLVQPTAIQKITIWNRAGFEQRLAGFTLRLLDADRKDVFAAKDIAAPQVLDITPAAKAPLKYLAFDGKPGKPVVAQADAGGGEPPLADVPADYRDPLPSPSKTTTPSPFSAMDCPIACSTTAGSKPSCKASSPDATSAFAT